ncbi:MAG TPA: Cys-tRNA(Pro) deacylase [Candidatus Akkermansia intestinigallinarum]|uniref:Cys-tRNA(Pro)/Cys-tRNA(Cys) deacylase n=1 Tax=Candidatus Akkermansia intestinigallinarum TaxID=2838431 RepID=A0A9D2AIH6_9BACT|nr:Cys-tRNA(Pro) deacylase [Candidatus Akkermansia intestinigallinarum]
MKAAEKTNVMRLLEQKKIPFSSYTYESEQAITGLEVAERLGQDPAQVFKTLVTTGRSGAHYVFVIPVGAGLDLRKAAKAVGEKSLEMLKQKELLPLTGYVHGGCSPIGMKKHFRTVIDASARNFESIIFSGGRIGLQVQVGLEELSQLVRFETADLTTALIHN